MLLSNDRQVFKSLIELVSRELKIAEVYIEKDFYAISILKELVSRNNNFVFKGGTSLSVCQHIINRFSEDVDISYAEEHITVGTRKAVKKAFFESIEAVSLNVANSDDIRSKRVFNRYLCPYDSVWNGNGDQVIVEWATQTPSFPIEEKEAQTIIGRYLSSIGRNDLIEKYNLESFIVKTITKERTLVDKIYVICDYYLSGRLDRQSRHIYDIYQLLKHVELNDEFLSLFNKVKEFRLNLETCYSVKTSLKISDLLFDLIKKQIYIRDYNTKTFPLLYDGIAYNDAIKSVTKVASFLLENNL